MRLDRYVSVVNTRGQNAPYFARATAQGLPGRDGDTQRFYVTLSASQNSAAMTFVIAVQEGLIQCDFNLRSPCRPAASSSSSF